MSPFGVVLAITQTEMRFADKARERSLEAKLTLRKVTALRLEHLRVMDTVLLPHVDHRRTGSRDLGLCFNCLAAVPQRGVEGPCIGDACLGTALTGISSICYIPY